MIGTKEINAYEQEHQKALAQMKLDMRSFPETEKFLELVGSHLSFDSLILPDHRQRPRTGLQTGLGLLSLVCYGFLHLEECALQRLPWAGTV